MYKGAIKMGRNTRPKVVLLAFMVILHALALRAEAQVFTDDFSVDSRSEYTVVNTWTEGGVGQFSYAATGQRLRLLVGDNVGLEFGRQLPASEQGVFQVDFLPTKKYPNGGTFKLRLMQDASNYYEVYSSDGYGPGGIFKWVNGQIVASAPFQSGYVQNTSYRVDVSFSTSGLVVQAFGNVLSLSAGSSPIRVSRFTLELRQQDAYIDDLGCSDDLLTSMVSLGDSITRGSKDSILSDGIGYPAILERLLTERNGSPQIVFNEGISGHTSADGLSRVAGLLNKHTYPRAFLVQYGSNDAQIPIPSGLGLSPGDQGYPGSFKYNMQRIISQLISAGKNPYLAKLPFSLGTYAYLRPYLQQYNAVVDELAVENGITAVPPDFYCFFEANTNQIADGLHPNGIGYQSMALLWRDTLAGQYGGCN
jgi:lysophospholipase L1-like esterase